MVKLKRFLAGEISPVKIKNELNKMNRLGLDLVYEIKKDKIERRNFSIEIKCTEKNKNVLIQYSTFFRNETKIEYLTLLGIKTKMLKVEQVMFFLNEYFKIIPLELVE